MGVAARGSVLTEPASQVPGWCAPPDQPTPAPAPAQPGGGGTVGGSVGEGYGESRTPWVLVSGR